MEKLLSPRQVARAIGVSESSLKRWCDSGRIQVVRTLGGHRRLPVPAVLRFLRDEGHRLAHPEVLGLPSNTGRGQRVLGRAADQLAAALGDGDVVVVRQIVFDLYLADHPLSTIADRVLAPAFHELGRRWECGDLEVYRERRACDIAMGVAAELLAALNEPDPTAPLAMGGAPETDPYALPTKLVEIVLRGCGWRATSLGTQLPMDTLRAAIEDNRPQLFWLSVSHIPDPAAFLDQYRKLYATAVNCGVPIAVGGSALSEAIRTEMQYSVYCDRLQHLESFLSTLLPPEGREPAQNVS